MVPINEEMVIDLQEPEPLQETEPDTQAETNKSSNDGPYRWAHAFGQMTFRSSSQIRDLIGDDYNLKCNCGLLRFQFLIWIIFYALIAMPLRFIFTCFCFCCFKVKTLRKIINFIVSLIMICISAILLVVFIAYIFSGSLMFINQVLLILLLIGNNVNFGEVWLIYCLLIVESIQCMLVFSLHKMHVWNSAFVIVVSLNQICFACFQIVLCCLNLYKYDTNDVLIIELVMWTIVAGNIGYIISSFINLYMLQMFYKDEHIVHARKAIHPFSIITEAIPCIIVMCRIFLCDVERYGEDEANETEEGGVTSETETVV